MAPSLTAVRVVTPVEVGFPSGLTHGMLDHSFLKQRYQSLQS